MALGGSERHARHRRAQIGRLTDEGPPDYVRWTGALWAEARVREDVGDAIAPTTGNETRGKRLEALAAAGRVSRA